MNKIQVLKMSLEEAKEANHTQRLQSFSIAPSFSSGATATKLAMAGFVAIKTSSGVCFGCPNCKLVCDLSLNSFNNPQAFHKSQSPNCSMVNRFIETEQDSTAMETQAAEQSEGVFLCFRYNFKTKPAKDL